jgi:uncharacterized membrane protein YdjX (TVP38/TMEM64 family)
VILGGTVLAGAGASNLAGTAQAALRWAQAAKGIGWIVFAVIQVLIVTSGILPASLAGMAAGAVYGIPLGFGLAAVSTMAGAVLTLAISRSLARGWVERFMADRPRLQNLDGMLARDGARLVCLLRLSPVMPFAATSYALGLSSVSVRAYVLGTTASLPALLGYVVLGRLAVAGLAAGHADWLHWAMLGVGGLATIVLTLELGRLTLRAGLFPPFIVDTVNRLSWRA